MNFIELDNLLLLRDLTRDQKSAVFELIKSAVAEATSELAALRAENMELRAGHVKWFEDIADIRGEIESLKPRVEENDKLRAELLALRAELESETRWADQYKRERDAANEKHSDSVASRLRIELEQTRNQLAIAQQEAWKLREALLEINPPFVRLSESDPESYCLWCGNNKAYGHASNCKYAAALTQRNDAEKVK